MYSGASNSVGFVTAIIPILAVFAFLVIYWALHAYDMIRKRQHRNRKVNIKTGSFGDYDPLQHLLEAQPLGGVYLMQDGQAVPFLSANPINKGEDDELQEAQTAVRFLMYAMDRDDWKYEFSEWESTLEDRLRERSDALRRERLMASLRVIPGGKMEDSDE